MGAVDSGIISVTKVTKEKEGEVVYALEYVLDNYKYDIIAEALNRMWN